ncbi:BTB/POZ domain-containing protein At2g13690 [Carica papaya]|uniref:BTB/POZ domain-containing protein At2g13690 n=1 Tax=Carica papaya TaxID=3649 RepID=UPI000B8C7983|nr:BTB/POZ domain-containing protein At2g13690 [Carica papaya]
MDDSARRRTTSRHEPHYRRRSWCCYFNAPPSSPENRSLYSSNHHHQKMRQQQTKPDLLSKPAYNSVPNSPQSAKSGLTIVGRIDPRRILSPGRVSPIDSDPIVGSIQKMSHEPIPVVDSMPKSRSESFRAPTIGIPGPGQYSGPDSGSAGGEEREEVYDARLNMKGKNGAVLVLELNSEVLAANSEVFAELISEHKRGSSSGSNRMCRIEVPEVDNLGVFRETIELMFEDDENITKKLLKMGVYRAIDVLEVQERARHEGTGGSFGADASYSSSETAVCTVYGMVAIFLQARY